MANTEIIDKLVSDEALKGLETLDTGLKSVYGSMEQALEDVKKLTDEFDKQEKSLAELNKIIEKTNEISRKKDLAEKEELKLLQEKEKLTQQVLKTEAESQKVTQEKLKVDQQSQKVTQETLKVDQQSQKVTQEKLKVQVQEEKVAREKIKTQQQAAKSQEQQNKATKKAEELARSQEGSINKMRQLLAGMVIEYNRADEATRKKLAPSIKQLQERINAANASIGRHQGYVGQYGKALAGLGKQLIGSLGVIGGIALFARTLKGGVNTIVEFQQANVNLSTTLQKNVKEITALTESAKQLGATTEWMASQVTQLQTELAKLGFKEGQILDMQEAILRFATATGAELPEAAKLAGSALRSFGMRASETEDAVSVMAVATAKSALDFNYLESAMSTIAPVAKAFGFNIKDTVALLGTLANAGFNASSAATATRNILLNLADDNGKLAKELGRPVKSINELAGALKELQARGVNLADTLELTDKRSVAAFNAFMRGADTLVELRGELEGTNEALRRMQKDRLNTVEGSTKLLKSAWESLVLSFSKSTGVMKGVIDMLTSIINVTNQTLFSSKNARSEYEQQIATVAELEVNTSQLVVRYEELTGKTELSKDEQVELNKIISTLKTTVPGVVTEFDKYGNALSINTQKVWDFIEAEKAKLSVMNADAIKEQTKKLKEYEKTLSSLMSAYNEGGEYKTTGGGNTGATSSFFMAYTPEQFAEKEAEIAEYKKLVAGTQEWINDMNGTTAENQLKAQKEQLNQRNEFNRMTKKQLQDYMASYEEANGKMHEIANEVYNLRFSSEDATGSGIGIADEEARKKAEQEAEKRKREEEKRVKQLAEDIKSLGLIEMFRLKQSAEVNKEIISDDKKTFDERRAAAVSSANYEIEAINKQKDAEISAIDKKLKSEIISETAAANQKALIREKAAYEIVKIEAKRAKDINSINADEVKGQIKGIQDAISQRSEEINQAMQDELTGASENYKQAILLNVNSEQERNKITEKYQRERLEIIRKYNRQAFDFEFEQLNKVLENTELTEDQKADVRKKLNSLQKKNAKELADYEIKETERKIEKMLTLEQQFNKFLNDERVKSIQAAWVMMIEVANSYYDNQISRIDELEKREQEYYDEKLKMIDENLEAGTISEETADARRRIIEESQLQREKEYEKQRKEMQRKQAAWQKANAIIQAMINTGVAFTSALGLFPPPLGIAMAAIVGALGAAQVAMIASKPIPNYAEGTKRQGHPGGFAVVGDGGRPEMVITPSGQVWKTPPVDTLAYLPKGTEVLPDFRQALINMFAQPVARVYDDNKGEVLFAHDDILRSNTGETNRQLSSINKGVHAIRANSRYSAKMNYMHLKSISRYGGK